MEDCRERYGFFSAGGNYTYTAEFSNPYNLRSPYAEPTNVIVEKFEKCNSKDSIFTANGSNRCLKQNPYESDLSYKQNGEGIMSQHISYKTNKVNEGFENIGPFMGTEDCIPQQHANTICFNRFGPEWHYYGEKQGECPAGSKKYMCTSNKNLKKGAPHAMEETINFGFPYIPSVRTWRINRY